MGKQFYGMTQHLFGLGQRTTEGTILVLQYLGKTLHLRTYKVFLQFLYPEGVYFMNQGSALGALLGNLHIMQMKPAIMKKSVFLELLIDYY